MLIESLRYSVGDAIGDFRGLISSVRVDDRYFRSTAFGSVCQLGCVAPLGELDACIECSRKVVGDYSDPHLWCVIVSGVYYYGVGGVEFYPDTARGRIQ